MTSRARQLIALVVSLGLMLTGLVLGAEGAHAASSPSAISMNSACNAWAQSGTTTVTVTGAVGDTFTATSNAACPFDNFTNTGATGIVSPGSTNLIGFLGPRTLTIIGSGTYTYSQGGRTLTVIVVATSAATPSSLNMDLQCTYWNESGTSDITVSGYVGDRFQVVKNGGVGCFTRTLSISGATGIVTPDSGNVTTTLFTIVGPGTFSIVGGTGGPFTINVTVTSSGSGGGGAANSTPPPDIFQSVAMNGSGTCASLKRSDLDWAAAETGNWTQSWEQWANGGKGGPVCRRVLWFDSNNNWWRSSGR
jgi:hypothetical protein